MRTSLGTCADAFSRERPGHARQPPGRSCPVEYDPKRFSRLCTADRRCGPNVEPRSAETQDARESSLRDASDWETIFEPILRSERSASTNAPLWSPAGAAACARAWGPAAAAPPGRRKCATRSQRRATPGGFAENRQRALRWPPAFIPQIEDVVIGRPPLVVDVVTQCRLDKRNIACCAVVQPALPCGQTGE